MRRGRWTSVISESNPVAGGGGSGQMNARMITFICLLSATLTGCFIEFDPLSRNLGDRMFFVIADSTSDVYTCELDSAALKLRLKGLYKLYHTDQGLTHIIDLRVECQREANATGLAFDPSAITARVRGAELSVNSVRTVRKGKNNRDVTFDIGMQDRQWHTTISVVANSPEFYEPLIRIDLSRFVKMGDSTLPIDLIVACARDPSLKR